MIEAQDVYVFASDYPHWDADSAATVLRGQIPEGLRTAIQSGNALETFPRLRGLAR